MIFTRKTILVVDDDEDLLYCYQMLLENEKTLVYTVSNPDDALALLQVTSVDLALLDFMLPGMTGAELAKQINELLPSVKIFFISGYNSAVEAIKNLDITVYGVFKKPIEPSVLEKLGNAEDYEEFIHNTGNISATNLFSNI